MSGDRVGAVRRSSMRGVRCQVISGHTHSSLAGRRATSVISYGSGRTRGGCSGVSQGGGIVVSLARQRRAKYDRKQERTQRLKDEKGMEEEGPSRVEEMLAAEEGRGIWNRHGQGSQAVGASP